VWNGHAIELQSAKKARIKTEGDKWETKWKREGEAKGIGRILLDPNRVRYVDLPLR